MGDIEEGFLTEKNQKRCLMCCGCLGVLSIIIFAVAMSAYAHLGPDDQILIKTSRGKRVINGPGSGQMNPFQSNEWRKATLLDPLQYAIVQDQMTAIVRTENGPKLLFLQANDKLLSIEAKIVLEKDEYIRYVDKLTGEERVEKGAGTIVPAPTEITDVGVEKAVPLNVGTAVEIRNKKTGDRSLVTSCTYSTGVYTPEPLEEIVAIRSLIHVLPHEAMIVRDVDGKMTVYSGRETMQEQAGQCGSSDNSGVGGTAFFLPPYSKIVRMSWSSYPNPAQDGSTSQSGDNPMNSIESDMYVDQASAPGTGPKRKVAAIDLRTHKSFYSYDVRTSDNVKLSVEGTIFWQIEDVRKMIVMTADPEGDVWSRSRSTVIAAVSNSTLGEFMVNSGVIIENAFKGQVGDVFFVDRGIKLVSMEMTKYTPVDEHTKDTLQHIIRQTVQRINDLQKQRSENDVQMEKLTADIKLEENRTTLIEIQANNSRLLAETEGATDGGKVAHSIGAFIDGLNVSLPNITSRMDLYKQHKMLDSSKIDTEQLTSGQASLYMAPKDMELRLQMPHESKEL